MFSSRLHDMSTFQLFQRQALQNNSFVSCASSSYSSWRPFDFTLSSLDAATKERDWFDYLKKDEINYHSSIFIKKIGYVSNETLQIKIYDKDICNIRVEELTEKFNNSISGNF